MARLERNRTGADAVLVGEGVGLANVDEAQRQGLRAFQLVVGCAERQVDVGAVVLPAELGKELPDMAGVVLRPAIVGGVVAGGEPVPRTVLAAGLEAQRATPERAARQRDRASRPVRVFARAALAVEGDGAAQRVQPEGRVGARNELNAGDRGLRDQVPVDRIAERLVDAHPVEEDRDALRRAEQRRGRETAEVDVGLKRVALRCVDGDAGRVLVQELGQVARALLAQVTAGEDLRVRRQLAQEHARARQLRRADHLHLRQLKHFGGIVGAAVRAHDATNQATHGPQIQHRFHCR